jgi:hypothetical protein
VFGRFGDALLALLNSMDGAGVRSVAEHSGGAAVDATLAALDATLHEPHVAQRFAALLALLCEHSTDARRTTLACVRSIAAVCTLVDRAAELHLLGPLHALCVLLQADETQDAVAQLARARGAPAAVLAALRAHPGDA